MLASNYAYITNITDNKVLIKFNPDRGLLKERMIYNVSRNYRFPWNDCQADLDSLVHKRTNELLEYKTSIDKDPKSVHFKRFYRQNEFFNSQDELDQLKDKTHLLHSMFGKKGNSEMTIGQVSRIKINEVFD